MERVTFTRRFRARITCMNLHFLSYRRADMPHGGRKLN
ncbi:hypothetical protein GGR40_001358 [Novosphingobium gossypii]